MSGIGLVFCGILFGLSCRVLLYFQSVEIIGDMLSRIVLSMILLTFFSLLIFSHIIAALSNLFASKDLELCHSMPVLPEEIFLSRFFHTFMDSSWMLIIFGLPIFLAYGYVYRPGLEFYFSMFHLNLAMALIAAGIGILVTMILVYIFPAQRTKDVIMLLSVVMVVGLYLMFRFLRPERLVNPDAFFTVTQYLSALKAPQSPYLPTQWILEVLWGSLTESGGGHHLFEVSLTWITAMAMVVINVWAAHFVYFEGFSKSIFSVTRFPSDSSLSDSSRNFRDSGDFRKDTSASNLCSSSLSFPSTRRRSRRQLFSSSSPRHLIHLPGIRLVEYLG